MTDNENNNTHDADSGAYATNALSPEERTNFEAEMASNERLRNEVTELTDTAVLLGLAVTPVQPSPELRSRLMAQIASTPQLPKEIPPVRELRAVPRVEADEPPAALASGVTPIAWYRRPARLLVAAAAAVIIIAGGVVGGSLVSQNSATQQQANALAAINAAPDAQHASAAVSTGGKATVVWSASLGKSAIIVNDLKALPSGKTYEAWYINSKGVPTPAGLFETSGDRTWRILDGSYSKGDTIGVTVEPDGGSKAPTTKPIVAVPSA